MLDVDCELLYIKDRPENFVMQNLAVPPIAIRAFGIGRYVYPINQSKENDISQRLTRIINTNASLSDISESFPRTWSLLQYEFAQYITSNGRLAPSMELSRASPKGFVQRLQGKQGRFRSNLSSKCVEYTGWTIISPDPNLKVTEVGVPNIMAQILTYPERVSHQNIVKLKQCVRNGCNKYPGAKFVHKLEGGIICLSVRIRKQVDDELSFGDIVHRYLQDGDIVLCNRQPSLHQMSIMCHRAIIMPWHTLRFNASVCNPYNADFDGDKMNIHVPQTEEAQAEALLLMGVQKNLCTPKNGTILVASTQDFLTTSFLLTRKGTFYDRASFSHICCLMGDAINHVDLPTPAIIKPIELWAGKQVFSVLLRPNQNMRVYVNLAVREKHYTSEETMCLNDGYVYFRNSDLLSGQPGKATLGNNSKDGLYSVLLRDYNSQAATTCMNHLAKLSARWIGDHGFSFGIDDVQLRYNLKDKRSRILSEGTQSCDKHVKDFNEGKLNLLPGCDASETLEVKMTHVLNNILEDTAKVCMDELHWRNSALIMSQCGSKGSPVNICQMVACIGQQMVNFQRAPNGFIDRSLPHFPKKSKTPAAKGFVANSFYSGLTATEFFHAMAGREDLVDMAVKINARGYLSRTLVKALEDLSVQYDNTVINSSGCVIQFRYGADGRDPSQMEGKHGSPINFDRLLMKVKATWPARACDGMSPSDILKKAGEKLSKHKMPQVFFGEIRTFLEKFAERLKQTMRTLILDGTEPHCKFLENIAQSISGITSRQLEVFIDTCISRYHLKKVEPGTPVGTICALSIGEPGTQMTRKTSNYSELANRTIGFPRLIELIYATKRIKTPIIVAKLQSEHDLQSAKMAKSHIEKTTLGQVAKSIKFSMNQGLILVTLDVEKVQALLLNIDAETVKHSILKTPKLQLQNQHIQVLDHTKLSISLSNYRHNFIYGFHLLRNRLPTVVVKGIDTVERIMIQRICKQGELHKYELLVEGTGLQAVMETEGINGDRTASNHIMEIQQALGIEAAAKSFIIEIGETMKEKSIDPRHFMLLADLMTLTGELLGLDRCVQKMENSVLMLTSLEKTGKHLFNAAAHGRVDEIKGVTECIFVGKPTQMGTGMFKIQQSIPQMQLNKRLEPIIPEAD